MSGKKELAINLPTSGGLASGRIRWLQGCGQGACVQQLCLEAAQPQGTFMLPMPNPVSINTMCFFFHAGFGALLFSTFRTGQNASKELRLWLQKTPRLSASRRLGLAPNTWGQPGLGSEKLLSKSILCSWEHLLGADILGRPHFSENCLVSQILGMIKNKKHYIRTSSGGKH